MSHLPPDYIHHDDLYRKFRARGANGWNDEQAESYQEMFEFISPDLPPTSLDDPIASLEIGCGAGNFSLLLAQHGYKVTGVDISPTAIEWACERTRGIGIELDFRVDNVLSLSTCSDGKFDLVVDGHCLHCIIGEDRASCLTAVWRVLKPGGSFVVLTMCGELTNQRMLTSFDLQRKVTLHQGQPTRYIGDVDAIVSEVSAAGFVIESVRVVPRKDADDLDNLIVRARKPLIPTSQSQFADN
jgi:ubiquinone/menaquinone biosynthesis C-methylase UbiE